jgi:hypothetical protein
MVPSASRKLLERKKERLKARLESLSAQMALVDLQIQEIDHALQTLDSPANGKSARKLPIFRSIKFTKKDWVLAEVRRRPKTGITRTEITRRIAESKGAQLNPNTVTTYLHRLSQDGLVRYDSEGGVWLPIE